MLAAAALRAHTRAPTGKIEGPTGRKPRYYRSGTAYYDEVAVRVAADLGEDVAGFSLLGDAGATYSREEVRKALLAATPGDIIILGVAGGNIAAILMSAPPVIPWDWASIGFAICSLIGIVFGVYPAWKASNLDPIDALRYE